MDVKTQKKLNYLDETKQLIREAIEEKGQTVSDSDPFRSYADKILAITGGGSAELRYVTFMNDDGTVELGKKAVAVGDDCADPIARGVFDTPTKESTAQYNYTFSGGWATTPNGGKDANALKAVTEDRTVYANFIATVRYYTITFYDSDGTTVLTTKSVAYGSVPSYTPTKEGVVFAGWNKELEAVTGDASYIAVWSEKLTFANALWSDIARVSEAGQASQHFSVGDKRTISVKWLTGATADLEIEIIGIDHDDLSDGSGKAGITIGTVTALRYDCISGSNHNLAGAKFTDGWANSTYRTNINNFSGLPTDMSQYIKTVKKKSKAKYNYNSITTTDDKLFIPSGTEFTGSSVFGTQYAGYNTAEKRKKFCQGPTGIVLEQYHIDGLAYHSIRENNSSTFTSYINDRGELVQNANSYTSACICFCI